MSHAQTHSPRLSHTAQTVFPRLSRLKSFQENNGGARANRLDVYMYFSTCALSAMPIYRSMTHRTYEHVRSCMQHSIASEAKLRMQCSRWLRYGYIHGGDVLFMSLFANFLIYQVRKFYLNVVTGTCNCTCLTRYSATRKFTIVLMVISRSEPMYFPCTQRV